MLVGTLLATIGRGLTLPYLFVYLSEVRGLNAGTVGLLAGWMGVVSLVLAPFGGTLVDRFGARRVVLPLFFVEVIGSGSLAFVTSVPAAFVSLTLVALGFSALFGGQYTILASLVSEKERQRVFGLNFTLINLGIGLGGIIGGLMVDPSRPASFQMLYLLDGVSYLFPAAILLSMPHVGRRLAVAATTTNPSSSTATSSTATSSTANSSTATITEETTTAGVLAPGGYLRVLRDRTFMRFFLLALLLVVFSYAQIDIGFAAFSTRVSQVPARVLGFAFTANTVVIVIVQLFVLRWLQGRSRSRALALAACVYGGAWLVLAGAGLAGTAAPVLAIVATIAGFAVFGLGETLMSPVMPSITNALATDELRGRYNALAGMVWGIGGIAGPITAGPIIGSGHGMVWVFMLVGGCLVAAMLLLDLRFHLTAEQDGREAETGRTDERPINDLRVEPVPAPPAAD